MSQELADAMLGHPPKLEPRFDGPLPRELVAVIRKATAPQQHQRYASVLSLADDVRRFLRDEPVSVLSDPAWIRVWRRLKRRPGLVLGALAVSLLLASSALLLGLIRELGARERAAARAERIFALTAAADRTARNVDAHLRRVELLLQGLARAAAEIGRSSATLPSSRCLRSTSSNG